MDICGKAGELLINIRRNRPLIHHITNYVTMNDCANIILALGGSPIMANDPSEAEEVAAMAKALVLNLGTPGNDSLRSMLMAGKKANELNIPVVFDPVGAGVTCFRKGMCTKLLAEVRPSVIKGNISEILHLSGKPSCSSGVDSSEEVSNIADIVKGLAKAMDCVVAATGRTDIVSDGSITYAISNGHEMLSRITGTGCMTSSLIGAFCSLTPDCFTGAAAGILAMGISGQLAHDSLLPGEGVGMFKVRLLDNVYRLDKEIFIRKGEIYVQ